MAKWRSSLLNIAGLSWPVRLWAASRCSQYGVAVARSKDTVALEKDGVVLRVAPKHIFFAPAIAESFASFARVRPMEQLDGSVVVDFASHPDLLNIARMCLAHGVIIDSREEGIWLHKENRVMILAPKHLIYAVDMADKFELYYSALVPREQDGLLILDYSRPGTLQKYASSGLEFEMASFPEEEGAIEEYFRWYRPKRGDLVFDMGAHCGVSTYYLSKLVGPEGKVISFEPDPCNLQILKRNIQRHSLTNVTAVHAAVAATSGELAFNAEGTIGSALVSLLQRDSVGSTVMVQAMSLADAFAKWGTPAFCKIDIEGAEIEVLAASEDVLRRCPTNFALDTNHPQANGKMTDKGVEAMFQACGYETASEANPLLTTWAKPNDAALRG